MRSKKRMKMIMHLAGSKCHSIKYQVEGEDIYCEVHTPVIKGPGERGFGKPKISWYHADDPNVHDTYKEAAKFKPKDKK